MNEFDWRERKNQFVKVGIIRCFDHVEPDKAQALKVLEEAGEVFGEWQNFDRSRTTSQKNLHRDRLLDECADVIQATINLLAALGVNDFRPWIDDCSSRNRERGRITDGAPED